MTAVPGITTASAPPNTVVQVQPGMNVQPVVLVDQNGQYVAPVTSAFAASSRSLPLYLVPLPSGDTTGATDTANISAVETAATTAGGELIFAPGTYYTTGLTKQATTIWQGAGRLATIIQLANGSNADVVKGANFSTLTLSGSTTGGIGGWGIRDLTIDGNKANQSGTSYGLRVYGYEYDLTRVSIRNCLTDGLYTEFGNFGGPSLPDKAMEANYYNLKIHDCNGNGWRNRGPHDSRVYDLTIWNCASTSYGYWAEAPGADGCTVASGSNTVNVSTFAGSGTLNVNSTLGFPAASISSTQGSLTVVTSGTSAVITYTGVTATAFTGCTTISGNGTLSTGGAVTPTGGGYSASLCLLDSAHVYGTPLWNYVLDAPTNMYGCIGEVGQPGGGMVLVRTGECYVTGSYFIVTGATQNGCGIQVGDTVNPAGALFAELILSGFAGTSAATAAVNVVNDGGAGSVTASVYQPSGSTVVGGTPATTSRYNVIVSGQGAAASAALSLAQNVGQGFQWLPAVNAAWQLRTTGNADILAVSNSGSPPALNHVQSMIDKWWSGNYSTETVRIDGGTGAVRPGTTAGLGTHIFSGSGAPNITGSVAGDFYLRTDTPSTTNQRIYIATGANTWTGVV